MNNKLLRAGLPLLLLLPAVATAQRHPRYLSARSDLQVAQQLILTAHEEPNVMRNLNACEGEIAAAIREIDNAAVLDGRDLRAKPSIDTSLDRPGRFRKVLALLDSARADLAREEDNPAAARWRSIAYRRIDAARDFARRAMIDAHLDRQ
jgi:hypothetical protein